MMTRKRLPLLAAICLPLLLGGCSQGPADVTERFTRSVAEGNFADAIPLLSSEVRAMFEEEKLRMVLAQGAAQARNNGGLTGYRVISEEVSEDGLTARVSAETTFDSGIQETTDFSLVKEDGDWKINMDPGDK